MFKDVSPGDLQLMTSLLLSKIGGQYFNSDSSRASSRLYYLTPVRNTLKTFNSRLLPHITIQPLTRFVNLRNIIILNSIKSHNHKQDIYKSLHIAGRAVFAHSNV